MSEIKIIPLGGVRENGKNMYVVEVDELIFVLDCGLIYPDNELLGIDIVIPDFTYLEQNKNRIAGIFLSHGHEDAVGALPYFLENIDAPVFGTELTIELAKISVKSTGLNPKFDNYHVINEKTEIEFDNVTVKFFRTTHSIPDSVAICLDTTDGTIVYTGDFKFDQSASEMYKTDFAAISQIGQKNVLALLSDSSDAESYVENVSDMKVTEEIIDTFNNAEGRVIVSCVASNVMRIQQVFDAAYQTKRKIFMTGTKLVQVVDTAINLGKLILPSKNVIVTQKSLDQYQDDELVILETGQSGEPFEALQRMSKNKHKQVNIQDGDLVYITTTPSTAMEKVVARTKNMIYSAGGSVKEISDTFKVSGHATPNDLKLLMNLLNPTFFIPVQGDYRLQAAHAELAHEVGIPFKNIFIPGKGDVIEYKDGRMRMSGQVPAGNVLIDGIGVGDIGNIVLRDRKLLADDGVFIVVVTISRRQGRIVSGPEIISRGFVYMKASEDLIKESTEITKKVVEDNLENKDFEWSTLKQEIRDSLSRYLFDQTKRRPVILPIIMEASSYLKK
ncbi:ribonuclease J [Jeotgalibaca ciconiae]|uniref:Ribonuclease J n=1 Tax=Jeotgalibaca ciconiae TaxID=2496265 RepID=A0A3Q9BMA1_9LACT|nr:ribonuclease J [Jeotgalibaca ciconiae]AZP05186.1 ribonuclease J [Jeotgalibaca ciconiae]HJB24238.1 ribonuclease J [Candidatus Jeotgalibaca pullicola]